MKAPTENFFMEPQSNFWLLSNISRTLIFLLIETKVTLELYHQMTGYFNFLILKGIFRCKFNPWSNTNCETVLDSLSRDTFCRPLANVAL